MNENTMDDGGQSDQAASVTWRFYAGVFLFLAIFGTVIAGAYDALRPPYFTTTIHIVTGLGIAVILTGAVWWTEKTASATGHPEDRDV